MARTADGAEGQQRCVVDSRPLTPMPLHRAGDNEAEDLAGLASLRSAEEVSELRGITLHAPRK